MDWSLGLFAIAAVVTVGSIAVIVGMIIGAVKSTRDGADWSAKNDRSFLPWSDEER